MDWYTVTAIIAVVLSALLVLWIKLDERRQHQKDTK